MNDHQEIPLPTLESQPADAGALDAAPRPPGETDAAPEPGKRPRGRPRKRPATESGARPRPVAPAGPTPESLAALASALASGCTLAFNLVASRRGAHWRVTEEEAAAMGQALAVPLAPYMERAAGAMPWAVAAVTVAGVVMPRLDTDSRLAAGLPAPAPRPVLVSSDKPPADYAAVEAPGAPEAPLGEASPLDVPAPDPHTPAGKRGRRG